MKKNILPTLLFLIFCGIFLVLGIRGIVGNPTSDRINDSTWKDEGPFELSPERGRFALAFSIAEYQTLYFSLPIARFATPDLGFKDGNYVSLFAPGVSFIIIPGYIIGKMFGVSQVGTFAVISLFALLNAFLIRSIAIRLKASPVAATIVALVFLFATPAFAYAVSLFQHHISTFLILLSIYILVRFNNIWSLGIIWFLVALSIPIDYPNLFLMAPIGFFALGRLLVVKKEKNSFNFKINLAGFLTLPTVIFPLLFFLWFNSVSYGSPFQLSGTVSSVKAIDAQGRPTAPEEFGTQNIESLTNPQQQDKSAVRFFKTRNLLNGFYTHFISPDRGIIFFTPVVLLGLLGIRFFAKTKSNPLALFLSIVGVNILLYSMWGDPWGGWAFGSRYLIPSYAILSILLAFALTAFRKNILFLSFFFVVLAYSLSVNTLGAITTSRNPPQSEILALEKLTGREEKYTYMRNLVFLDDNRLKSFAFESLAKNYITAWQYYLFIVIGLVSVNLLFLISLKFIKEEKI